MNRYRLAAAVAGLLTVLLLQATVIAPVVAPVAVSLPAVLVGAIALVEGPGSGIAFGFAVGLTADLASDHPAGVLALCWLAVGIACGLLGTGAHSVRRDAAVVALVAAAASVVATVVLALTNSAGATVGAAFTQAVPALAGDALLALGVVPLVRRFLRSDVVRKPAPVPPLLVHGWDRP